MATVIERERPRAVTDGRALLALDPDHEGSCPCAELTWRGTRLRIHCWRVCGECAWSGVHHEGSRITALRAAVLLNRLGWSEFAVREGA